MCELGELHRPELPEGKRRAGKRFRKDRVRKSEMSEMKKRMYTLDELGQRINKFGMVDVPAERAANRAFIANLHSLMREGAIWGWPDAGETYEKKGDGFVRTS